MTMLQKEMVSMPPPGKWSWNDDKQTLEFTCSTVSAGVKKKRKASKTPSHQDLVREHLVKISRRRSSAKGGSSGLMNIVGLAELNAYKAEAEYTHRDSITIEDIKKVAVSLMQENEGLPIPLFFLTMIKTKDLDEFLVALLLYLHCFWHRKAVEERADPLMVEQSLTERRLTAEAIVKLELAKKHLAVCYSSLVLGHGLYQQHRMACGRSRVSTTYRDRHLYECLYSFFCYVAWVTFGRRDLKGIQTEIGRLLRHDTFNPALRAQRTEGEEEHEITQKKSQHKTISNIRKCWHRQGMMLNQCTPVLMSILPSTEEKVLNLFQTSRIYKQQLAELVDTDVLKEELSQQLASCSFGILGKPRSQLTDPAPIPNGAMKEDEEADQEDNVDNDEYENDNQITNRDRKTSFTDQRSETSIEEKRNSFSRAHTVTSRATTEAPLSDTE